MRVRTATALIALGATIACSNGREVAKSMSIPEALEACAQRHRLFS
ncbi:MAG: hypothetical protein ACJ784_22560 [Myxococcales bacterium]